MRRKALVLVAAALCVQAAFAGRIKTVLSSSQDLWRGAPAGTRVSEDGVITTGPAFERIADIPGTPLCALQLNGATIVGTGPSGDLLKVEGPKVKILHHFAEPLITSLAMAPGGNVLVGTSGPARIYEVNPASGEAKLAAEIPAQYLWAIANEGGGLVAASGVPGKLWRIAGGRAPEQVADFNAAHARCLLQEGGTLWIGTASPAALYSMAGEGTPRLVATLPQEEVAGLALDGKTIIVAANEKTESASSAPGKEQQAAAQASSDSKGAAIYRLERQAVLVPVRSLDSTILSTTFGPGGAFAGTKNGALVEIAGAKVSLVSRWPKNPVSALVAGTSQPEAMTSSPGALYQPSAGSPQRPAYYVSPVIDASTPSRPGVLSGFGGGGFSLDIRAGNSPEPDAFWSAFVPAGDSGNLPPSRYFQWRAAIGAPGAFLNGTAFSYRPVNRPPVLEDARVGPPGEISVKNQSQLGERLVQEIHEKDRPFPSLAMSKPSDSPPQTYYLYGFRMISWKASDPDGDDVRVDVKLRPEGSTGWITLADSVADPFYVFETRALPDGRYQIELSANDGLSNPEGDALTTVRILPLFEVDNTPPAVVEKGRDKGFLVMEASDNTAVEAARFSVDGKPWEPVEMKGLIGAKQATLQVPLPPAGRHFLAIEVVDPYGNSAVKGFFVP